MTALAQTYWTYTCKFCYVVRKILVGMFIGLIAMGEQAGRARAASELANQGYYKEAKALMLEGAKKKDV